MAVNPPVVDVLPPASTQTTLTELLPGTTYTALIYHLDAPPGHSFSTPLVVTFTTATAQATAQIPQSPAAFAGQVDEEGYRHLDGTFGVEVTPMEFPSIIVMEVAIETAVGSGVPAGFAAAAIDIARISSNSVVNRTRITASAPHDGLQRFVRAYATRRGAIQSGWTNPIMVDPWGPPVGAFPNLIPLP
jgi:hypothetical protein